jgi:hypothetical protein
VAIYVLSDIGSVAGGWGSSKLMQSGRTANTARKTTMLICALAGGAYIAGIAVIHFLSPRLTRVTEEAVTGPRDR